MTDLYNDNHVILLTGHSISVDSDLYHMTRKTPKQFVFWFNVQAMSRQCQCFPQDTAMSVEDKCVLLKDVSGFKGLSP